MSSHSGFFFPSVFYSLWTLSCPSMATHPQPHPEANLLLSQSQRAEMRPEWAEIFLLKHFFPVQNTFSNHAESSLNTRTISLLFGGYAGFFLKIPPSRYCIFRQL